MFLPPPGARFILHHLHRLGLPHTLARVRLDRFHGGELPWFAFWHFLHPFLNRDLLATHCAIDALRPKIRTSASGPFSPSRVWPRIATGESQVEPHRGDAK